MAALMNVTQLRGGVFPPAVACMDPGNPMCACRVCDVPACTDPGNPMCVCPAHCPNPTNRACACRSCEAVDDATYGPLSAGQLADVVRRAGVDLVVLAGRAA